MPTTNIADIFKDGKNFKLKDIDFSNKKIITSFKKVSVEQKKSLARKNVDWNKLSQFYITI